MIVGGPLVYRWWPVSAQSHSDSSRAREPRVRMRFRRWLTENYRLAYRLNLIATYALLILYLVSLVTFGDSSSVPKVVLGIFSVSGFISIAPLIVIGRGRFDDKITRAQILAHRSAKVERIEKTAAAVIWALILATLLFAWHFGLLQRR